MLDKYSKDSCVVSIRNKVFGKLNFNKSFAYTMYIKKKTGSKNSTTRHSTSNMRFITQNSSIVEIDVCL